MKKSKEITSNKKIDVKKLDNKNIDSKTIEKVLNLTDEKILAQALQEYLRRDKVNGN